jgi:hypothetical protein
MSPVMSHVKSRAALVLVGLALTSPLAADGPPPRDLRYTGDHWTAWEPPTPPAGAQVHTIAAGDTLWALAAKFLGNPYLWPQLWEQNQYIRDAHWIYPGDPLVISYQAADTEPLEDVDLGGGDGLPADDGAGGADGDGSDTSDRGRQLDNLLDADRASGLPVPLGAESDIYCSGFIGTLEESFPYAIIGSEYEALHPTLDGARGFANSIDGREPTERVGLASGDIVYLNAGAGSGVSVGQVLSIVEPDEEVVHPVSRELFGRLYRHSGRLKVLTVQDDTAIAEIVHTCEPVLIGSQLRPFEPEPVPLARRSQMRPPNMPSSADSLVNAPVIVLSKDRMVSLGQDNVVYIDRGLEDNVSPGDIFTVYRLSKPGLPPVVLGELAVLSVSGRSSVARIINSRYTIHVGDRIEAK